MKDTSRASAPLSPTSTGESPSTIIAAAAPEIPSWNKFDEPRPYVTVSGMALDARGRMVLLHRSDKVRSAKNCWSLPSGLHEVGLSMAEQFGQELREELNLTPVIGRSVNLGMYENIRPEGKDKPGWHWVIAVLAMRVESLDPLTNKEPDKHDMVEIVNLRQDWISGRIWGANLREFLLPRMREIKQSALNIL